MKKRLFTNFFDEKISNKKFKVSRNHKGKVIDNFGEFDLDIEDNEIQNQKISFLYIYFFFFIVFSSIIFRLFYLQIIKGDYFLNLSRGNRLRAQVVMAPRGFIYDSKNNPLVKNIANFQVILEPFDLPSNQELKNKLINSLSKDLDIQVSDLDNIIASSEKNVLNPKIIKENLSQETALKIKLKYKDFPAVRVEAFPTREYLEPSFSHILGYISRISQKEYENNKDDYDINDYIGKNGLELNYEEYLKGKNGRRIVEVDASGNVVRVLGSEEQLSAKVGNNIYTFLDTGLQKKMLQSLEGAIHRSHSKAGSVVAINPQNGSILGMVSFPYFDNNLFVKNVKPEEYKALTENPQRPLFNRSISGIYPPGSIIKPVVASAGLQEKVINSLTTIQDKGTLVVKNQYNPSIEYVFKDWKLSGHGGVNVIKAIEQSCDIFFYYVGGGFEKFKGLGASRLEKYFRLFGLGEKLGIDLPEEEKGLVPTPDWKRKAKNETWYTGDNYHMAIGQGDVLVTPLQAVSWTAAIANGGTLYKPRIVYKITDQDNNIIKEFKPEVIRKDFISPENIEIVRRGMRRVVTSGTGQLLNSLPVEVAGKTGTAQYGPRNEKQHAWFIAFAPYNNPEIALAVIVEGGGEGHQVAAPVAKEILEYYFKNK